MTPKKRIGILTSGGDCAGLNAAIRAVVHRAVDTYNWEVIGIFGDRQTVIDDGVSKRLTLKKGPNVVRCAVFNAGGATDFCARFLDAEGEPLKGGFMMSLNPNRK